MFELLRRHGVGVVKCAISAELHKLHRGGLCAYWFDGLHGLRRGHLLLRRRLGVFALRGGDLSSCR